MLAVVLAAAGLSLATAAEASAAPPGCSSLRQNQRLGVAVQWRYYIMRTRLTQSFTQEVRILGDETRTFARLTISGATCKRRNGRWDVVDPVAVGYRSEGIDGAGKITNSDKMRGWGIGIRSAKGGAVPEIRLQVMHCGKGNFFSVLKEIVGVPLPIGIIPSLALYGGGKLLPSDKVTCGNVGTKRLRIYANRVGLLRLVDLDPILAERHVIPSNPTNPNLQWTVDSGYDVKRVSVVGP